MPDNNDFEARRKTRQKEIKRRRRKKALVFGVLLLIATTIVLCFTAFFKIETVKITGSNIYESEEIIEAAGINNKNMFTVSSKKLEEKIRTSLPYIDTVLIKRKLPHTVTLTVKDAKPYAFYTVKNNYYLVSEKGYVLERLSKMPKGLTEIKCSKVNCALGKKVSISSKREEKNISELLSALHENGITVNSIDVSNAANIQLKVEGKFQVDMGTKDHITQKVAHLKGMIESINKEDPAKKGRIDLSMWTVKNSEGTFKKE